MKKLFLSILLAGLSIFANAQSVTNIQNGGTGASTVSGAWHNIFSGSGLPSTCASVGTSAGSIACTQPASGLVASNGTNAWRSPLYTDVVPLWQSGMCFGYLFSDGTCSIPTPFFVMQTQPPTGTTYITVYPSGHSTSLTGGPIGSAYGSNSSGLVTKPSCGIGNCGATPNSQNVVWTFTLPSYINPSNVTAIYAQATASTTTLGGAGWVATVDLYCSQSTNNYHMLSDVGSTTSMSLYQVQLTGVTGSQLPTVTCTLSSGANNPVQTGIQGNVSSIYLQVADSVDTAPTSTSASVVPPLWFNTATQQFGLDTSAIFPVYNHSGTAALFSHVVVDSNTFSSGTRTITFTGSAVFSSNTSYTCNALDNTAANPIQVTYSSGSSVTFTGTTSDSFTYTCIGN